MSIRALKTFLAIHKYGSFSAAAEAMGLTQSAVSLQIKKLEQDLSVPLFDRTGHRSVLNAHGRALLTQADQLVTQYEQLPSVICPEHGFSGTLTIGSIITMQVGPLPGVLRKLIEKYPNLYPVVQSGMSGELAIAVEAGRMDFALTTEPQMVLPASLSWQACYQEIFYVLVPASCLGDCPRDILSHAPFIRFDRQAWIGRIVDQRLRQDAIETQDVAGSDSLETVLQMVRSGIGASILPLSRTRMLALQPELKVMPFSDPPLCRGLGLLSKRGSMWGDLIQDCVDMLQAQSG